MSIRLSPKHGLNPAIPVCFFCGEDKNEIILAGRLSKDAEAPRKAVWDKQPCDKCKSYMKQGIILIEVSDTDQDYRMGGFAVVKENAIRELFTPPSLAEDVCKRRVAFVATSAYKMLIPA